jgi:hypothetical protein
MQYYQQTGGKKMRVLAGMILCLAPAAWGTAILGSTVTGDLNFNGGGPNYYDPANGFVPATGYLNSASNFDSPTVVISATTPTFGYQDGGNTDVSNFSSGTQLVVTDTVTEAGGNAPIKLTFTDTAFVGITLASNNFPNLTYGIVGDVITINIGANGNTTVGEVLTGTFNIQTTATPEPSSFGMIAAGSAALIWLRKKA